LAALLGFSIDVVTAQSIAPAVSLDLEQPLSVAMDSAMLVNHEFPVDAEPGGTELLFDAGPLPEAAPYEPPPAESCCTSPCGRPVSWISGPYLKSGVAFALGSDLLEDGRDAGYAISGGTRQELGPGLFDDHFFFDVGGSYLAAFGDTTRITTGRQTVLVNSVPIVTAINFRTELDEVRRGSAHVALGRFWGAWYDDPGGDPQIRIASRLGGRVGSIRGSFQDQPLVAPPAGATIEANYSKTDVFGGIFFSTEAILLQRQYAFGHLQWTLDAEFANDWVNLEGFHSGSLTTAALTLGFMLSR
jgi:hypothetical protein